MKKDENWAVARKRIEAFFREQSDVQHEGDAFRYYNCVIHLEAVPSQAIGKWEMPRTRVIMEGDDADVQEIHGRFFLRFLSAGG